MFDMKYIKTMAAAAVLVMSAGVAQAATCSIGGYNFTLNTSVNQTCVAGNDLGNSGIVKENLEFFGLTDWALGDSSDVGASQTGEVEFALMPIVNTSIGIWSIDGYNGYDPLMIVLKASTFYGAFLISEVASGLTGAWSITRTTDVVERQCTKREKRPPICVDVVIGTVTKPVDLSHTSIYHQPATVPVPAAGFLLLGALGGLAALRRRKVG